MRSHALFWIALLVIGFLTVPVFSTREEITARVIREVEMIQAAMGNQESHQVTKTALGIYEQVFVDTGFIRTTKKMRATKDEKVSTHEAFGGSVSSLSDKTDEYLLSVAALCYTSIVRMVIILAWLPYITPYLVAVALDALMVRKIKFHTFGESSRVQFSIAAHVLIAMIFLPLIYLVVPIPTSPLAVPFWTLAMSVPLVMVISNTQRI